MHYGSFEKEIIKSTPRDQMMVLDIETSPPAERPEDLLRLPKQFIGIGCMYLTEKEPILFVAEDEGKEYELDILKRFNGFINQNRPLIITGFGISSFDRPLLSLKMKSEYRGEKLWAINDMVERAYFLCLSHSVRFYLCEKKYTEKPTFMRLEEVVKHQAFKHLDLKREEKEFAKEGENFIDKGKEISRLWKKERQRFEKYLSADVHNCCVLFKFIFNL